MTDARERHGAAFVTGAMLGGIAGAVWGLLNTATTGAEARVALGQGAQEALDRLVLAAADAEVTVREWFTRDDGVSSNPAGRPAAWPAAIDADPGADTVVLGGEALVGEAVGSGSPGIDVVIDGPRPVPAPAHQRQPDQPA